MPYLVYVLVFLFALYPAILRAQDITLQAHESPMIVKGVLQNFDGDFYHVKTKYGFLTIDRNRVSCDGPACPDGTNSSSTLRISGMKEAGMALLPPLLTGYAQKNNLRIVLKKQQNSFQAELISKEHALIAQVNFIARDAGNAQAALDTGKADLIVSLSSPVDLKSHILAYDALVPLVAPDNPQDSITSPELAQALFGTISNWQALKGPDRPVTLHNLAPTHIFQQALNLRLGRPLKAAHSHTTLQALALAVSKDQGALALGSLTHQEPAKPLALTDKCGFIFKTDLMALKSGDYPLMQPVYLLAPKRRVPAFGRDLISFITEPEAQNTIHQAGYINRFPETAPLVPNPDLLAQALKRAQSDIDATEITRLANAMQNAKRFSLTFRYSDFGIDLDAQSQENMDRFIGLLEKNYFQGQEIILAGFSNGFGPAPENLARARAQVEGLRQTIARRRPESEDDIIIAAFGEAMPMACDNTPAGRHLNRRVEIWLRPSAKKPDPANIPPSTDISVP